MRSAFKKILFLLGVSALFLQAQPMSKKEVKNLIIDYIVNRETINHIDDSKRFEIVRLQSSNRVWQTFENALAQDSAYTNEDLKRNVEIINITIIRDGYAYGDIATELWNADKLQHKKHYRVHIRYYFNNLDIDFSPTPKNPTNFQVVSYEKTETTTPDSDTLKNQKRINKNKG